MIGLELACLGFTIDALGCVPVLYVIFDTVGKIRAARHLALTKILHSAESVLLHALGVLNNFLNNNGFREAFLVSFSMHGFCGTVKKTLFTESKSVSFGLARNFTVNIPIIITLALFTGSVISVSLNVHLLVLWAFLEGSSMRVKNSLGISTVLGGAAEGRVLTLLFDLVRPFIGTVDRLAKGFTFVRSVVNFTDIVELIGETSQVLGLNNFNNRLAAKVGATVAVISRDILLEVSKSRMHLNFSRFELLEFAVLKNVRGSAWVSCSLISE